MQRFVFPIRYWPKKFQWLLAVVCVLLVLMVCFLLIKQQQAALDTQQQHKEATQHELDQIKQQLLNLADKTKDPLKQLPTLPNKSSVDNLIKEMAAQAEKSQIQISSISIEQHQRSKDRLPKQVIAVQLKASYAGLKSWLSVLLAQNPWLTVQQLSIRQGSEQQAIGLPFQNNALLLESTIIFVLYVQD